jgi:hypothetical protein
LWTIFRRVLEKWSIVKEDGTLKRHTYTQIFKELRASKKRADGELAKKAKEEFGDQFNSKFSYKKNGRRCVMRKPEVIARRYRDLKGDVVNEDDEDDNSSVDS